MNIDQMPAGDELDVLVAKGIFGWTKPRGVLPYVVPHYSTDIVRAFQVVDKLLDGTRVFVLESWMPKEDGWQATFKGKLNWEAARYEQLVYAQAETRPLAICRAALKVMAEGHE